MGGTDNEVMIGNGTTPDGAACSYHEIDRPGSIGAPGSTGYIVEVRDGEGKRITHSDNLAGLEKAGYKVGVTPAVVAPEAEPEAVAAEVYESPEPKRGPGRPKKS